MTATVSNESLAATVTGNSTHLGEGEDGNGATLTTGAIAGSTLSGFAGIQTASTNTGLNSAVQAATSIAANANVTFGSVH